MKKFVVVGGGTAGWITALYTKKKFPNDDVTVIESKEIGILGAGEGSTPDLVKLMNELEIPVHEFISDTGGTFKNGIKFSNWSKKTPAYPHNFDILFSRISPQSINREVNFNDFHGPSIYNIITLNNEEQIHSMDLSMNNLNLVPFVNTSKLGVSFNSFYEFQQFSHVALHFDARKLASMLSRIGQQRGINIIDSTVKQINLDNVNDIESIELSNNDILKPDFVFDCTGFARLIIGKLYNSEWNDFSHRLPVDRALAFFLEIDKENIPPYTEAIAMNYGWVWKIPLQDRYGCGYVYDSSFISDEDAKNELETFFGKEINIVNQFKFKPGVYKEVWKNNCLAVGLSTGFLEPLEATSIAQSIQLLKDFFANRHNIFNKDEEVVKIFNENYVKITNYIVDFLQLHYLTNKTNTEFWSKFKENNKVSVSLKNRIYLMNNSILRDNDTGGVFFADNYYRIWAGMDMLNLENIKKIYEAYNFKIWSEMWSQQKVVEADYLKDCESHLSILNYLNNYSDQAKKNNTPLIIEN
jgi:tryptophan halogenase